MPQLCAVPCCKERKGGHKFPRDETVCKQWLEAIRRDNFIPSKHSRVCKKHFNPNDFELPKDSNTETPTPRLKPKAVPSQFLWKPESEESQVIKEKCAKRALQHQKKHETKTLYSNTEEKQCEEHCIPRDMENYMQPAKKSKKIMIEDKHSTQLNATMSSIGLGNIIATVNQEPEYDSAELVKVKQVPKYDGTELVKVKQVPKYDGAELVKVNQVPKYDGAELVKVKQVPTYDGAELVIVKQVPEYDCAELVKVKQVPEYDGAELVKVKQVPEYDCAELEKVMQVPEYDVAELVKVKQVPEYDCAELVKVKQEPDDSPSAGDNMDNNQYLDGLIKQEVVIEIEPMPEQISKTDFETELVDTELLDIRAKVESFENQSAKIVAHESHTEVTIIPEVSIKNELDSTS